uniref:DNA-directed DNA polymerase n=1 Tax=Tanacetum cinerariifolium TaxID=118510 RepID=A0A6L2MLK0_TANCI|nr:DNA-directed DNA polymerase [Tanacetum cinerariifolium]
MRLHHFDSWDKGAKACGMVSEVRESDSVRFGAGEMARDDTGRALIDVRELTLRVGNKAVAFNVDQTLRYSTNYDESINRIDVIDVACDEYSQEVLGFSMSVNPTPSTELIVSTSSPTLTPFGDSDFLFEETDAFLAIEDKPISPKIDDSYFDMEGDILLLEEFLNDDPSSPHLPPQELKVVEPKNEKSSIDEPPVVELKDLPPHLEYAFLEGDDKLPVIIAKDLKDKEKITLIKVLKSHKQALAWQLSDIKGINPEFCTHKILMEDDFKPAVQHQRRVNLKIHEVIKKEVLKLLDAGLIYPISNSPWVIPVHCVPKKSGFTVFENEENKLIPTRLVTGWCMMAIFHDVIKKTMEVFMDDFSVFRNSFRTCLSYLDKMLKQYEDTNLCINWEKNHFMVKEGIVLGHKISKNEIKVEGLKLMCGLGAMKNKAFLAYTLCKQNMTDAQAHYTTTEKELLAVVKPLIFLRLAIMDPSGDIMAQTTSLKRCLTMVSTGPQSIVMPMTWSNLVTLVNVREKSCNVMKCLKMTSKFMRFSTYGALISWVRSRLHEGTSIYSWPSITYQNGLNRKRSPPTTPELFANS